MKPYFKIFSILSIALFGCNLANSNPKISAPVEYQGQENLKLNLTESEEIVAEITCLTSQKWCENLIKKGGQLLDFDGNFHTIRHDFDLSLIKQLNAIEFCGLGGTTPSVLVRLFHKEKEIHGFNIIFTPSETFQDF